MTKPRAESASADRVTATRRIAASAHAVFVLVSDPARHVDINGSGMMRTARDATPLSAGGETFDIAMDRRPLAATPNTEAYLNLVRDIPDYTVAPSPS
jgi:hypothetical protein